MDIFIYMEHQIDTYEKKEKIYDFFLFQNNDGISCYMNSILSILQQLSYFSDYLLSKNYVLNIDEKKSLTKKMYKLLVYSYNNKKQYCNLKTFRHLCADKDFTWGEHQQQDSAQFLEFFITEIEKEIKKEVKYLPTGNSYNNFNIESSIDRILATKSWTNFTYKEFSILKYLFNGQEIIESTCPLCYTSNKKYIPFLIWQLPIPLDKKNLSIHDCINKWCELEILDNNNMISCDFCGNKVNMNRKSYLYKTPKYLIIQFKRFKTNMFGQVTSKITNKIDYPLNLDISSYYHNSSHYENHNYKLKGINIHAELGGKGNLNCGHYISIVQNRNDNKWYLINDDSDPHIINEENLVTKKTYLLFYQLED